MHGQQAAGPFRCHNQCITDDPDDPHMSDSLSIPINSPRTEDTHARKRAGYFTRRALDRAHTVPPDTQYVDLVIPVSL